MAQIRTKARALDMLGRQQIAGIPTALSELFKNAHDAYADNVEVDYIRRKNLLVLRDDGLGMTRTEFEERWLTIGTDSKYEDEDSMPQPMADSSKEFRQVMGEKGIGRLAIAAIGPQVLVVTRAKRNDNLDDEVVVAFINWTLFSLPAIDLSDIEIPLITKHADSHLSKKDIEGLLVSAKQNVTSLSSKISQKKIDHIKNQIDSFEYDPSVWEPALNRLDDDLKLEREYLSLSGTGHGTHFIISPVDEILPEEIEQIESRSADQASRLEKALLGFTNTMSEDKKPPIVTRFRDHTLEGECIDRISENIFFTPEEFKNADHHFKGRFNEFGQFSGTIKVFGQEIENAVIPWTGGRNKEITCGPFEINLAVVQGAQRDTRVPAEMWQHLSKKTSRIGGLYIYRDGIRVLPYGDSQVDFLRIELRRTKSHSEYYFSYRNMLGYIDLSKGLNGALEEKAGREGFIENKAYKQFRAVLENFFIQVAASFFVDKGELSDLFTEERQRHREQYEALKRREGLKGNKKKKLKANLEKFFVLYDESFWDGQVYELKQKVARMFDAYDSEETEFDDFAFELQEYVQKILGDLRNRATIAIPAGLGFGKEVTGLIDKYQLSRKLIEEDLSLFESKVEKTLAEFEDLFGNRVGLRRRFNDSLQAQKEFKNKQLNDAFKQAQGSIDSLGRWANNELKRSKQDAKLSLDKVQEEFSSTSFEGRSSEELYDFKRSLESKIEGASTEIIFKIEELKSQIDAAHEGTQENAISSNVITAALESEYEHLKEKHDANLEMVQLGMALGVVHHEFNNNIIGIRRGLKELQPWAEKNKKLQLVYKKIRTGFDHLDGYLRTFTPLARRLSRRKTDITGQALKEFIQDVFHERLIEKDIEICFSKSFLEQTVNSFTSTVYPAFVNLIDNSIHWVAKSTGRKEISLDADSKGFVIRDTGPGIPTIDQDNVFEFGFSRRLGGRGMGLYVAKQTLENDGFIITLDHYDPESGAVFRIYPAREENK